MIILAQNLVHPKKSLVIELPLVSADCPLLAFIEAFDDSQYVIIGIVKLVTLP